MSSVGGECPTAFRVLADPEPGCKNGSVLIVGFLKAHLHVLYGGGGALTVPTSGKEASEKRSVQFFVYSCTY